MNLDAEVKTALTAASALLPPEKQASVEAFIQAPMAGPGAESGGAIIGILKDMTKTFKENLENARKSAKAEEKAFKSSLKTLQDSHDKMEKSVKAKSADMGTNDGILADKKTQLEESIKQKKSDEEFLEKLQEMAVEKAKDYEDRKMMRANEDAAIAEAIAILNSDEAFETFGSVDATSTGKTSFLQVRRGVVLRHQVESLLEAAAGMSKSARLAR